MFLLSSHNRKVYISANFCKFGVNKMGKNDQPIINKENPDKNDLKNDLLGVLNRNSLEEVLEKPNWRQWLHYAHAHIQATW